MSCAYPQEPLAENLRLYQDSLKGVYPCQDNYLMMKIMLIRRALSKLDSSCASREPVRLCIDNKHAGILAWLSADNAVIHKRCAATIRISYRQLRALSIDCRLTVEYLPRYFSIPNAVAPFVPQQAYSYYNMPATWERFRHRLLTMPQRAFPRLKNRA